MALAFPKNPAEGQVYDYPPFRYQFTSGRWLTVGKGANTVSDAILAHEAAPNIHSMAAIQWQGGLSHRNLLINCNFDVNQRGTSGTSYPVGVNTKYYVDRWCCLAATAGDSFSWVNDNNGTSTPSRSYISILTTAGNPRNTRVRQYVESKNCAFQLGSKLTLSVSIVSESHDVKLRVYGMNATDNPASGELHLDQNFTLQHGSMQNVISATFTTTAKSRNGLIVEIMPYGSTSDSRFFAVTNVQLEEGPVATPFEHRPYGYELSLCQRYYQVITVAHYGYQNANQSVGGQFTFPVVMRVAPSLTVINNEQIDNVSGGTPVIGYSRPSSIGAYANAVSAGGVYFRTNVACDAEL